MKKTDLGLFKDEHLHLILDSFEGSGEQTLYITVDSLKVAKFLIKRLSDESDGLYFTCTARRSVTTPWQVEGHRLH